MCDRWLYKKYLPTRLSPRFPTPSITMTDNSGSEVAIARAKNTNIFQRWEKLASGDELKHGGRTFIKGRVNVVVGTMLTDEDRLIERINQTYASSHKQYLLKKQTLRKEKDELIRPALSPDDTPQTAAAKSKPTFWKRWLPLNEGGKIKYNVRWFMKDKEGNGEKELLEEIFNNNEKSRASRAKNPDGERDSIAAILFSLGEVLNATVMTKLPPSARGQNHDDFDNKKNEAEEGSKADREKNNNNDDNDDGGGTGDDGNSNECGGYTKNTCQTDSHSAPPPHNHRDKLR